MAIFGLAFAILGVVGIWSDANMVRDGLRMTASTIGEATRVKLYVNSTRDCEINYWYLVDGTEYTGYTPNADAYLDVCNASLEGQPVTVYYVPDNPGQSSLNSARDRRFDEWLGGGLSLLALGLGVSVLAGTAVQYRKKEQSAPAPALRTETPPLVDNTPVLVDKGPWDWGLIRIFVGIMGGIGAVMAAVIAIAVTAGGNSLSASDYYTLVGVVVGCVALGFLISFLVYRPSKLTLGTTGLAFAKQLLGYDGIDPASIRAARHLERVKTMVPPDLRANAADTVPGNGIIFVHQDATTPPRLWTIGTRNDPVIVANALIDAVTRHRDPSVQPEHLTFAEELTGHPTDSARQLPPVPVDPR